MARPTLAIYGIKDRNDYGRASFTHDHNLCLMENGKVLEYLQLERYSRFKYDNRLDLFLEELIDRKVLDLPSQFDFVSVNSFAGNAFISKSGRIRFEANRTKELATDLEEAFGWFETKKWKGWEIPSWNCSQELAHLGSCLPFYGEFKENSLLIHFDGGASLSNFSAFQFKNGKFKLLEAHWKLGFLSRFFNDNPLVFALMETQRGDHCSIPGKLMGYAALGQYDEKIAQWLHQHDYFKDYWNKPKELLRSINQHFGLSLANFDMKEAFFQNIAATFQGIFEEVLLENIYRLQKDTNTDYLYYSGGSALNIVANSRLVSEQQFQDVFIPPCCNDSGLSLGAASLLEFKKHGKVENHSPYLNSLGLKKEKELSYNENTIQELAQIIMQEGIVGICNGHGEIGPRALGNRSIIALPNSTEIAKKVSEECKGREWYRPIAPIMLASVAQKVTDQDVHELSKYMLLDFPIKEEFRADLAGVTHTNNTARIQAINHKDENPFMFDLLSFLYKNHGVKALINTSFNAGGEPIVHTGKEAIKSAKNMKLDAVIVNGELIRLKD
ncbi:carbamoyltransferase C-terminal domain-containing protein [Sediminitomix flava]|uniref:Carbamoyltransferase n=1 Tax=Sediminitomix flava TaxID=379075 RepID=A0A315ZBU1_SEDFL|nr:carbamoyltransferase C-terminal domain-containing protein [Sediminitomix flava]PWJ42772.1 carbamoyltransferase [Sediminitomix flava]